MSDENKTNTNSPDTASIPPVKAGAIVRTSSSAAKPKGYEVSVRRRDPVTGEVREVIAGKK